MVRQTTWSPLFAATALFGLLLTPSATHSAEPTSQELLLNGILSAGADGQPADFGHVAYLSEASASVFGWSVDTSGIGTLSIDSLKPNDARWTQTVPVQPGTWYRLTGWARTEDVGAQNRGAALSIMGTFHESQDLRGTQGWTPLALWVRTTAAQTTLEVACRLGGYASLNSGRAWYTALSLQASGAPPEGSAFVFGGQVEVREEGSPIWVQILAALVVVGLALLVWRYVLPPSAHIPQ